ncbi:3'-5' exonuclease [Hydromonas duriensis]|uniref:Exonuclease n=1 Tax=Hydromonas duriensis TaxID=1527608 RepID=A0A4R6Y4I2_9BURK|nr:3'-5' exonuclease [Hydromonas duriensis]TDR27859.1 exonuclease [Hydromonas duriensis]
MYLIFDTETTGIDFATMRLVEIAWLVCDGSGAIIHQRNYLIKPNGFIMPLETSKYNGITQSMLIAEGVDIVQVLNEFSQDLKTVDAVVAHNLEFDNKVMAKEYRLLGEKNPISFVEGFCTMKESTNYCKLPKKRGKGYKFPRLYELHLILFNNYFSNEHRALADAVACKNCFFELINRNVIDTSASVGLRSMPPDIHSGDILARVGIQLETKALPPIPVKIISSPSSTSLQTQKPVNNATSIAMFVRRFSLIFKNKAHIIFFFALFLILIVNFFKQEVICPRIDGHLLT